MRSGETKSFRGWLLKQLTRILPGLVTEWLIKRSHRADQKCGQRNFPEGLFVLREIKRRIGMMTGLHHNPLTMHLTRSVVEALVPSAALVAQGELLPFERKLYALSLRAARCNAAAECHQLDRG
jgi:hypothetical protein